MSTQYSPCLVLCNVLLSSVPLHVPSVATFPHADETNSDSHEGTNASSLIPSHWADRKMEQYNIFFKTLWTATWLRIELHLGLMLALKGKNLATALYRSYVTEVSSRNWQQWVRCFWTSFANWRTTCKHWWINHKTSFEKVMQHTNTSNDTKNTEQQSTPNLQQYTKKLNVKQTLLYGLYGIR